MEINKEFLKTTLDISVFNSKHIYGCNCPQFKRIHHNFHHIVLYIKDFILKDKCKNYFEIGTHYGHSLVNVLQSKYNSKYMAVDLFKKWSDGTINNMNRLVLNNVKKFNKNNYECKILKGSSQDKNIINKVKEYFKDGIDLLFIDGTIVIMEFYMILKIILVW